MPISFRTISLSMLFALGLAALPAAVRAQSNAGSSARIDFSLALDPNSVGSSYEIDDNGEQTYNLINSSAAPYLAMTGSGTATASFDPDSNFDINDLSGFNAIDSRAFESGPSGTATASIGLQENLQITNTGTDAVTFDVTALVRASGSVSATGAHSTANFANVDTYGGLYDFNLTTKTPVANPLVHLSGSDATGVSTVVTGGFAPTVINGLTYYLARYTLSIAPGDSHALQFYVSDSDVTAASPVPEPASFAALGLGALAVLRRRSSR